MKCPVCKTEYAEATFCPECGFESAVHLFINQNEADNWLQEVVKPYRRKYWESMKHKFIVKNDVLTSYLEASRTIEFPYGIEAVGDCVFFDCEDDALIEEVSIPASVKRIESAAFSGQKNLKRIHLKDGLEYIASIAFEGCGISSLYLPDTVTTIDAGFCFCKASISINPTNPKVVIPHRIKWEQTKSQPAFHTADELYAQMAALQNKGITTHINESASQFEYISYRDGVEIIRYNGNSSHVTIPNEINEQNVLKLGNSLFENCKWVTEVTLPHQLVAIGNKAFKNTMPSFLAYQW